MENRCCTPGIFQNLKVQIIRQLNAHIFNYNFNTQTSIDLSQGKEAGFNDLGS